ncbi:MAG: 5'/3'-nucleotidase SurE [Gammaproteobacteria bacterium]|nr:5'/3'-nucleotidase SurE [Gammaproteobacteria bacterium]
MKILVSNDDGYTAPGILALAQAMRSLGNVSVVAPDRNKSGASSSLTLDLPIRAQRMSDGVIRVEGTPSDCVHLALTGLLSEEPDLVVSGINNGANLGDDVIYSGTVAAAIEGRFLGLPAVAVSLVGHDGQHLATAAAVAVRVVKHLANAPIPANTILNVNVPDIPLHELKGILPTRLGNRHKAEPVVRQLDPRGKEVYWIGPAGPEADAGEGTDFWAVNQGYASVTPIQVDLTRHQALKELSVWLKGV